MSADFMEDGRTPLFAGLLKGFTGVDNPYEDPSRPELKIDTSDLTPDEAAQEVLLYISRQGYI